MIRFSLTTLLLVAFWIAALMLVWMWREPWVPTDAPQLGPLPEMESNSNFGIEATSPSGRLFGMRFPDIITVAGEESMQPTQIRLNGGPVQIIHMPTRLHLGFRQVPPQRPEDSAYDNVLEALTFINEDLLVLYRQHGDAPMEYYGLESRFPNGWFGHFYRPEVWLALALTGVLLWRGVRTWRMTRAASAQTSAQTV